MYSRLKPTTAKKKVLEVLVKRHFERLRGCNSAALEVLKGNPYYRGYLVHFLNPCGGRNKTSMKGGTILEKRITH